MKERPILMSSQNIAPTMDGRKTQTRRMVKPELIQNADMPNGHGDVDAGYPFVETSDEEWVPLKTLCPYGQPGDRLWVREAWRVGAWDEETGRVAIDYCDGPMKEWLDAGDAFERYWIQSTDDCLKAGLSTGDDDKFHFETGKGPTRWRPSIFMPRWASRITLEVTAVRVERLQEISEADAKAEGCNGERYEGQGFDYCIHREAYRTLWESINGPGSWDANSWVWVVEFKRINS